MSVSARRRFVGGLLGATALIGCKDRAGVERMEHPTPVNVTGSASSVAADASLDADRFDGTLRRWTTELGQEEWDALGPIFEPGAIEDPKKGEAVACIQLGADGRIRAAELAEPSADAVFNEAFKAKLGAAKAHSVAAWLEDLEAIAVANLCRRPEFWTVREKSKGFLGMGSKPTLLELIAEHAAARILDATFLQKAHEQLNAPLLAVAVPFRGVIWARGAAASVQDIAAFAEAVRHAFIDVPRGVEPISPHVFTVLDGKITGVIQRESDDKTGDLEPTSGFPWQLRPV